MRRLWCCRLLGGEEVGGRARAARVGGLAACLPANAPAAAGFAFFLSCIDSKGCRIMMKS